MGKMRRFLQDGAVFAYSLGNLQDIRDRYTITGAPTVVNSPYGNALNLDGAADYVTLAAEEEYNLRFDSGAQDFSIVAWVRCIVTGVAHTIFEKRDGGGDGWILYIDASDQVVCALDGIVITGAAVMTDALWHCVATVIDRDGNGQIYVDGVSSGAAVAIGGAVMATTFIPRIGANLTPAAWFNGDIYAVVIYDRILTPDEVLDLATNKAFDY